MLGIGGMGMAPLAIYLSDSGHSVVGYDDCLQPPLRALIEAKNIQITAVIPENVDTLVYSNAIGAQHPLYRSAVERGLRVIRRGELLSEVVADKRLVAIVGCHGKTTTTSYLIQLLRAAGMSFGYLLGGLFRDGALAPAAACAASEWVIAEIDESDGSIEAFAPEFTLLVSLDWDHADHYPTPYLLNAAFERLLARTLQEVLMPEGCALQVAAAKIQYFAPCTADFMRHNWNAALSMCQVLTGKIPSLSLEQVVGIRRRQEVLIQQDELVVFTDYAHHPHEVSVLLNWCRTRYAGKVIVVFEPHRYSRTRQFARAFAEVLRAADRVWLLPVYAAAEAYDPAGQSEKILEHGDPAWSCGGPLACLRYLFAGLRGQTQPTIIAFAGAGDVDRLARQFQSYWQQLTAVLPRLSSACKLLVAEPLAQRTTLRVGGYARYYAEPASRADLIALLAWARGVQVPIFFLGRGSNLIVLDGEYSGLVVRLSHPSWRAIDALPDQRLKVGAGVRLKEVCGQAVQLGWSGFEFLEGIPGSLGGALRMNAGAMGAWIFDVVESIEYYTLDGESIIQRTEDLHVSYRCCQELKQGVAVSAILKSPACDDVALIRSRLETYSSSRRESQPREPSAGCTFKNPADGYAGQWIDECGLKGLRVGAAEVSAQHGNFIVNHGGASADDVIELMRRVRQEVFAQKGVWLEPEVQVLGSTWEALL